MSKWGEAASRVDIEVFPKRKLPLGAEEIDESMYHKLVSIYFRTQGNSTMPLFTSGAVLLLSWIVLTETFQIDRPQAKITIGHKKISLFAFCM